MNEQIKIKHGRGIKMKEGCSAFFVFLCPFRSIRPSAVVVLCMCLIAFTGKREKRGRADMHIISSHHGMVGA